MSYGYEIKGYSVEEEAFSIPHDLARVETPSVMWLRSLPVSRNPLDGSTAISETREARKGLKIVRGYAYTSKHDGEDTHAVIADERHAIIFGDRPHDRRIIADVVDHFRAEGVNPYIAVVDEMAVKDFEDGEYCPF